MEEVINKAHLVDIRDSVSSDHPFIFATWLKGLRYGNKEFERMSSTAYYKHYHKLAEAIVDDFSVSVKIACLREDPDVILGYSVYKGDHLYWVFVKARWRGIGLARDLVSKDLKSVSHVTEVGLSILRKHPQITVNPFQE